MDPLTFKPRLADLDDRLTPSITPLDVFTSLTQVQAVQAALPGFAGQFGAIRSAASTTQLAVGLENAQRGSLAAASVLAEFFADLQTAVGTNPSAAGYLVPVEGYVAGAEYQAAVNGTTALNYLTVVDPAAASFLVQSEAPPPPVVPPPPAPPAVPAPPPIAPDANGLSTVIPSLTTGTFTTAADGLRTQDVTVGTGPAVTTSTSNVTLFYRGFLTDGTIFDAGNTPSGSDKTAAATSPSTFPLNGVVPGFSEGLIGMQPGGVRRIDIPSNLGYGAAGQGSSIPPNSELVFEVKLVSTS